MAFFPVIIIILSLSILILLLPKKFQQTYTGTATGDYCPGGKLANEKCAIWSKAAKLTSLGVIT
ncbi:hypothetical protein AG0111_0g4827 [Alternaria gaisen]|uniref:Uncharacterized protein n=1 Tax=Alternaria gaisen TaxID=167740 RepID=A0ACB6FQ59_9PLEO|nr:hypothetical protein AG0111_0g4827 [Alternaria gaisen]